MMKIRHLFSLVLVAALLFSLDACGGSSAEVSAPINPAPAAPTKSAPAEIATPVPTETPSLATPEPTNPEPTPTPINIDIPWTNVTYSVKDSNGYTFDITLKLSPWVLFSDTDLVNFVWDKVSGGRALPQFDDWGFTRSGGEYQSHLPLYGRNTSSVSHWYITDMYYCVGTVTIKNITSGFDITQSNPKTVAFSWGNNENLQSPTGHIQHSIGRILYSNDAVTRICGLDVSASMSSNTWGPVPIILMTPEDISPNTPNGLAEYILRDEFVFDWNRGVAGTVGLASENTQVYLGILKDNGEYLTK